MKGSVGGAMRCAPDVLDASVHAQPRARREAGGAIEPDDDGSRIGATTRYRVAYQCALRSVARERSGERQMLARKEIGERRFGGVVLRRRSADHRTGQHQDGRASPRRALLASIRDRADQCGAGARRHQRRDCGMDELVAAP